MDTEKFLKTVLPTGGGKILVAKAAKKRTDGYFYRHIAFDYISQLAEAAVATDKRSGFGEDVYFALGGYNIVLNKSNQPERKACHIVALRSFWVDIDCGTGKPFATKRDALIGFARALQAGGLMAPTFIVDSGYGLHIYWAMTEDMPVAVWSRYARALKDMLFQLDFPFDPARTADPASILRPIGTRNHKTPDLPPVKIIGGTQTTIPLSDFAYAVTNYVVDVPETIPIPTGENSDLAYRREYAPGDAEEVVARCAQLGEMRDSMGNVPEPVWRLCLGLLKHCDGGEQLAHEWSSGHPNYSYDETEEKLARWTTPPPTCNAFHEISPTICDSCPHFGKIRSPINGNVETIATIALPVPVYSSVEQEKEIEIPASMRDSFFFGKDGVYARVQVEDENENLHEQHVRFSSTLFYPVRYFFDEHGEAHLILRSHPRPDVVKEFELPCGTVGVGGRDLFKAMGVNMIVVNDREKSSKGLMERYLREWLDSLKSQQDNIPIAHHNGWQPDGSLVVGNIKYLHDGTVEDIRAPKELQRRETRHFSSEGSLDTWLDGLKRGFNGASLEHQFLTLCGYGSPLVSMFGNIVPAVIVSAYSPTSGHGKTTAAMYSMSIWGNPHFLQQPAQGTTLNALWSRLGYFHNLPFLFDEITQLAKSKVDLSELVYSCAAGQPKARCDKAGNVMHSSHDWSNLIIMTSNKSLVSALSVAKSMPDAELNRIIEFLCPPLPQVTKAESDYIGAVPFHNYGVAGKLYAQYIAQNRESVRQLAMTVRQRLDLLADVPPAERFWSVGMSAVLAGGAVAKRLGLHNFDMEAMMEWSANIIRDNRRIKQSSVASANDAFGMMLLQLQYNIIITDNVGTANNPAFVMNKSHPHTIDGRFVFNENRLYLAQTAIKQWCADSSTDMESMRAELHKAGILMSTKETMSLTKGTVLIGAPVKVWTLDISQMVGVNSVLGTQTAVTVVK